MKVTFTFSGLPHYLIALLNKLVHSQGVEVSVILPRNRGMSLGEGIELSDAGGEYLFKVYRLDEYRGMFNKPYFKDLHRTLREISPDILVMGWPFILNYCFDFKSRRVMRQKAISLVYREIPFMVAPRNRAIQFYRKQPVVNENMEVENPTGWRFYPWAMALNQVRKWYYRLADATMVYASSGVEIHESFGIPGDRIFVTYNSPDTDKLAASRERLKDRADTVTQPARILHLGRLVKWKRVDLLIEAVGKLSGREGGVELRIIGSGPEEEHLKQLATQKVPGGEVTFLGSIYDPDELAREILSSGIYVLAGMGGLSINEAMAFGKPVICSRCDGTERDLVQEGINGLYFKEGDAEDLALKIESLLNDPQKARAMGEKSLSVINDKINLETVTRRFRNCFEELMRTDPERPAP
jgi:glycosyltransferase involved in cell wall biosynthesis